MIKKSKHVEWFAESRGWWNRDNSMYAEWTYEGDRTGISLVEIAGNCGRYQAERMIVCV